MSSLNVAPLAASARVPSFGVPIPVVHEQLWSGGVIELRVPAKARAGVYDQGLQFVRNTLGGVVNMFVHTDDTSCRGKLISAEIKVMMKKMGDGRSFLYFDLKPVPRSTEL